MSTSISKAIADRYAQRNKERRGKGAAIEIRVRKGTPALFIGNESGHGDEGEILFGRDHKIRIIENKKGRIVGELSE